MRVLGIDPGSHITGYGIVEHEGSCLRHVDNGGIRPDAKLPLPRRLQGQATKHQVQQMVRMILSLPEVAFEDASDALAVAICHCQGARLRERIAQSLSEKG